jgi:HD-like signal output (HDOD) protein
MKVTCDQCNQSYNIPDERLPSGKKVTFPCPACKNSITLDLRNSNTGGTSTSPEKTPDIEATRKKIIKSMSDLPPMPEVVMKAQEIMADPNSNFKELGKVIETDQAIAARVLKLANSAYYGLRGMVSSIHQASIVLGYEALGELITVVGASGLLDNVLEGYRMESGLLWQHSLAVAFGSRIIAIKKHPTLENDAFSAGLLHDSGKIVMDPYISDQEEAFDAFMEQSEEKTFLKAEKVILGFDHAEIAYDLCSKWGIPENQSLAIKFHHQPSMSEKNELAYILHAADLIAMKGGIGTGFDSMNYTAEENALEFIGLSPEDLDSIVDEVVESVDKISEEIHG